MSFRVSPGTDVQNQDQEIPDSEISDVHEIRRPRGICRISTAFYHG